MKIDEMYQNISKTPSDVDVLKGNFSPDSDTSKMVPTVDFLRNAYELFDGMFFDGSLPDISFQVKSKPRARYIGFAAYNYNDWEKRVIPTYIELNSSRTLSLHDWLGVVLHEIVHIYDYQNFPERFLGYRRRSYDAHGKWFIEFGSQYKKYGFTVEKYCNGDLGINTEDNRVNGLMKRSVLMHMDGWLPNGKEVVVRISEKDIDKVSDLISKGASRGRYSGLKGLTFYKSQNPNIVKLKQLRMRDSYSTLRYYFFDESFHQKYGPFEKMDSVELLSVHEDKDEVEYGDMHVNDDITARRMYDNIKGVVDVKKLGNGEFEVGIF